MDCWITHCAHALCGTLLQSMGAAAKAGATPRPSMVAADIASRIRFMIFLLFVVALRCSSAAQELMRRRADFQGDGIQLRAKNCERRRRDFELAEGWRRQLRQ
jgi:hypothetical protein